jgi:lysophospholipase L1-like esterase
MDMSSLAISSGPAAHTHRLSGLTSTLLAASLAVGASAAGGQTVQPSAAANWVASWTASPQPTWGADFAFPTNIPALLQNQTVRQVARISLGGTRLRLVFSNAYGQKPLVVGRASVALTGRGPRIQAQSLQIVTFGGRTSATIPAGAPLLSDPIDLSVPSMAHVTVSVYLPASTPTTTFHWDSRQTAWIAAGDQTAAATVDAQSPSIETITTRTLLTGIEVQANQAVSQVVAVIGDSITDGNGASVDADARWPDFLAARLAPHGVAVINAGISGARLLSDKMGVNALARFERDVLDQPGVRTAIVLLGINDISWPGTAFDPKGQPPSLDSLEDGFRQLIAQGHRRGVRVIGVTLTPFEGALHETPLDNYFNADKDALRQSLNTWIRESGAFDAVLDFDLLAKDRKDPLRFNPALDSGDHLHPGDAGNRFLANAIPLDVLLPEPGKTDAGLSKTTVNEH